MQLGNPRIFLRTQLLVIDGLTLHIVEDQGKLSIERSEARR